MSVYAQNVLINKIIIDANTPKPGSSIEVCALFQNQKIKVNHKFNIL